MGKIIALANQKGGVGKTTVAAILARLYADEGRKVLAADVDPDANLGAALGFTEAELAEMTPVSNMRKLIAERLPDIKGAVECIVDSDIDKAMNLYN